MKILAFVHAYVPFHNAGAETTLHDILRRLVVRGWEASVLLSKPFTTEEYEIDGVRVIPHDYRDPQRLNKIVTDYDVLISHLESSERAAYVARRVPMPMIHLVHNTMWQTEAYLSVGCSLAIYNSMWVAAHHEGADKETIVRMARSATDEKPQHISFEPRMTASWPGVVVHPPVDPSEYVVDGPHDHITLINLYYKKGPKVFYEMARRFSDQRFLAVLGGYGNQEIESLPNVEFLNNTPQIRDEVYARTKILLMPSEYESYGRVAVEAAASGIPTIATPTPGLLEALGPKGLYADLSDLDAWEEHVHNLLKPQKYASAKKQALARSAYLKEQSDKDFENLEAALDRILRAHDLIR